MFESGFPCKVPITSTPSYFALIQPVRVVVVVRAFFLGLRLDVNLKMVGTETYISAKIKSDTRIR